MSEDNIDNKIMFPFGEDCIIYTYQTETLAIPKEHIFFSWAARKQNVYEFKCDSIPIMSCKRNSYNTDYLNFTDQITIGDRIRYVRLHAGLTIEQLAKMIGVDRTTLIWNETGRVTEDYVKTNMLLDIEKVCSVPQYTLFTDYLLYYETQQLKTDRLSCGLTQSKLAELLNVAAQTIRAWESKKSRPSQEVWRSTVKLFYELNLSATSERSLNLSLKGNDDSSNIF